MVAYRNPDDIPVDPDLDDDVTPDADRPLNLARPTDPDADRPARLADPGEGPFLDIDDTVPEEPVRVLDAL
jgi:hypothetical protein